MTGAAAVVALLVALAFAALNMDATAACFDLRPLVTTWLEPRQAG